jgi:nicotinamide riboside kinase
VETINEMLMACRIVITGPESTGKSVLNEKLASHFKGVAFPEYAREYIAGLNRPYTKNDVLFIARQQINQFEKSRGISDPLFFDTGLIITKVWLKIVFNSEAIWIDQAIKSAGIDVYLLCAPDIPWIPDSLRENGGEMRNVLFNIYRKHLDAFHLPYRIIEGTGEERLRNAIFAIEEIKIKRKE